MHKPSKPGELLEKMHSKHHKSKPMMAAPAPAMGGMPAMPGMMHKSAPHHMAKHLAHHMEKMAKHMHKLHKHMEKHYKVHGKKHAK